MAGQEVGVAYYSLLPSTRGFGKAVEKELDGAADGHERKQKSLWSKVTQYGAIAAAAIGGLFTAKILSGGLSRALNIEDAQAKLKGLGHDAATITAIMGDALAAVKGTAFGLDQAATIAASAVAAGIKPGQQLERYLKLTADAATIAGASLSEMGSILNKVQGSDKAYNDSLQQLADRGIPIYQWLAEELGTTTDAVFKLASQGKISSEQFQAAIERNIAGAALASGDTTRGAFANMQAAMSRWGANLISGVLPFAHDFFSEMIVIFDGLNERTGGFVDRFNGWLKSINVEGFGDRFLNWFDRLDFSGLKDTYEALKPLIDLARELGPVLLGILGPALVELRDALAPVLPELASALSGAVRELAPSFVDLLDAVIPLIPKLVDLAVKLLPIITELLKAAVPVLQWVADKITIVFDAFDALTDLWSGKTDNAGFLDAVRALAGLDSDLARGVDAAETIAGFFNSVTTGAATALNGVQNFITGVGRFFSDLVKNVGLTIGDYGKIIFGAVTGDFDLIDQSVADLQARFAETWGAIAVNTGATIAGMWANVRSAFSAGVAAIARFPEQVFGFFQSLPARFVAIGREIVQGLVSGITGMVGAAVRSVTNLSDSMLVAMKNWLGIKSPSRVFRDEVGAQIAAGVITGVDGMKVQADAAIRSLVTVPQVDAGVGTGAAIEINANGVDPMTTALLVKREVGSLLAVRG